MAPRDPTPSIIRLNNQDKQAWLRSGRPLRFETPPGTDPETPADRATRTIQATWLEELAEKPSLVVPIPIDIRNAIIEGSLGLKHYVFQYGISILHSELAGEVDLSFASFNREVTFEGSLFRKTVNFRAAQARFDFEVRRARFLSSAVFRHLQVGQTLIASAATFDSADFEGIKVAGNAAFRGASFQGETRLNAAQIGGQAHFTGARFEQRASFDHIHIVGAAFFDPRFFSSDEDTPVHFGGKVLFGAAHIGGQAVFTGTQFEQEADFNHTRFGDDADFGGAQFKHDADFNGVQIGVNAFFGPDEGQPVRFGGKAGFIGAHIKGEADFGGAQFEQGARFDGIRIDGPAHFDLDQGHPVRFGGEANFRGAHIGGSSDFRGAQFGGEASFDGAHIGGSSDFSGAQFGGEASFDIVVFRSPQFIEAQFQKAASFEGSRFELGMSFNRAQFHGDAAFMAAVAERDAHFVGCVFQQQASFREARFRSVFFRYEMTEVVHQGEPPQFKGGVDLRGFTYERICAAWGELLDKLAPYDRQPYTQLETALRATGNDRSADDVYCARCCRERQNLWRQRRDWPRALLDCVHWALARYGVRPYRLMVATALVLAVGALVFRSPQAVTHREVAFRAHDPFQLSWPQAIGVSVNQFLPVEIPSGKQWQPTEKAIPFLQNRLGIYLTFATYATMHRLSGWLLVPLGVAALTGLLHRQRRGN